MRSFLAFLALVAATLVATVGLLAYTAHETVLEPDRAGEVLARAVDSAEVRQTLLEEAVPGYASIPAEYRTGLDQVSRSERVEQALSGVEVDGQGNADVTPVRQELASALEQNGYGDLAAQVRSAEGGTVSVPTRVWEPYVDARAASWDVAITAAIVAAALFLASVLVARSRRGAVLGVGLAVVVSAVLAGALFRMLPELAPLVTSDQRVADLAGLAGASTDTLVALLLPFVVAGGVVALLSFALPGRRRA